ncbi:MAG: hypothetical protein ACYDA8_14580 [Deferrisomatales bacterium]
MRAIGKAALAVVMAAAAMPVWGAEGAGAGLGLWTGLFLGFGALVVACQLVPAVVMFVSLLRGLWGRRAEAGAGRTV